MSEMIRVEVDAKQVVLDWVGSNAFIPSNKKLLRQIGDTNTILLSESISQFRRWEQQGKLQQDGSFYWTQMDCEIETGYSRSTQTRAFKDMEKRGLLKTESRKSIINGEEKSIRFILLNFAKIAELMFSDDEHIISSIKEKYEKLKKQNQESRKKTKEKARIQNESSLEPHEMTQSESSERGFKMNHPDDSKWVTSKKNFLLKNNLEEEEEKNTQSELVSFLLSKNITLENALIFETKLLKEGLTGFTNDQVLEALELSFYDFVDGHCTSPYKWAVGKLKYLLDGNLKKLNPRQRKGTTRPIRVEMLPSWFDEDAGKQATKKDSKKSPEEQAKDQQRISELMKKLNGEII
jgi:hypothetical protein